MRIPKSEITQLLKQLDSEDEKKDSETYDQLFELVYDQLKKIAHTHLEKEYSGHEYSKTALVHEVYLKMINQDQIEASDRSHFYAIASRCMRQILIDYARKMKAQKRGGEQHKVTYIDKLLTSQKKAAEIINIDQKLKELANLNKRLSEVVELRFFGGMSINNTAKVLDISTSTVKRDWKKARGWLYKELK